MGSFLPQHAFFFFFFFFDFIFFSILSTIMLLIFFRNSLLNCFQKLHIHSSVHLVSGSRGEVVSLFSMLLTKSYNNESNNNSNKLK